MTLIKVAILFVLAVAVSVLIAGCLGAISAWVLGHFGVHVSWMVAGAAFWALAFLLRVVRA